MAGFSKSLTNTTPMAVRDICRVIWLDRDAFLHTSSHTSQECTLICYRARNEDSPSNAKTSFKAYLTMVSGVSFVCEPSAARVPRQRLYNLILQSTTLFICNLKHLISLPFVRTPPLLSKSLWKCLKHLIVNL